MRGVVLVLCGCLVFNSVLATPVQSGQALDQGLSNLVTGFEQSGWRMEDGEHHQITVRDFAIRSIQDIYLFPPANSPAADLVFRSRTVGTSSTTALIRQAITVYDRQSNRALSRRMIQIDQNSGDATAVRLRLLQTMRSMENEIVHARESAQVQHPKSLWNRLYHSIIPSAYASEGSADRLADAIFAGMGGVAIMGVVALSSFQIWAVGTECFPFTVDRWNPGWRGSRLCWIGAVVLTAEYGALFYFVGSSFFSH